MTSSFVCLFVYCVCGLGPMLGAGNRSEDIRGLRPNGVCGPTAQDVQMPEMVMGGTVHVVSARALERLPTGCPWDLTESGAKVLGEMTQILGASQCLCPCADSDVLLG